MKTKGTKAAQVRRLTEALEAAREMARGRLWGLSRSAGGRPPRSLKLYRGAVEEVAHYLRPRFESGELRGWLDGDSDGEKADPPIWRVERTCERYFIRSPEAALVVARSASTVARANAVPWEWNSDGAGFDLRTGASSLMAIDVLLEARRHGWSRPKSGETPKARRTRSAA